VDGTSVHLRWGWCWRVYRQIVSHSDGDVRVFFWIGGLGMGLFAFLLTLGQTPPMTILATLFMGYIGSWTLVVIQAALADKHGEKRTVALTEANVIASVTAMLAPALVGLLASGWRGALYIGFGIWAFLFVRFGQVSIPTHTLDQNPDTDSTPTDGTLPKIFWLYWLMGVVIGSVEWSIIFWASDFFDRVVGLPKNYAAAAVSAFFVANVIGRALGSRFARTLAAETLMLGAVVITCVGFPIFWLSPAPILNIGGLFLTGLGVSNLYPFILSLVARTAPNQSNTASARISLAMGIAILVTPQVLASFADQVGIRNAYTVVVILLALLLFLSLLANRVMQKEGLKTMQR
jgi:MFS family permease